MNGFSREFRLVRFDSYPHLAVLLNCSKPKTVCRPAFTQLLFDDTYHAYEGLQHGIINYNCSKKGTFVAVG